MTKQEIFNTVWNGLKSQGFKKSIEKTEDSYACAYRGNQGRKCAAGWLLPDDKYDPEFNVQDISFVPYFRETFSADDYHFIRFLQKAHDDSQGPKNMEKDMAAIAKEHRLEIPE